MKKLKFIREKTFKEEIHRAGWNWVTKSLVNYFHDDRAEVLVDEFIERTFDWDYTFNNDKDLVLPHHRQPWIGFIHNPIVIPKPFDIKQSPVNMCARLPFILALKNCKGIFTLSYDLEESIRHLFTQYGFENIPIETLVHPTPLNVEEFNLDKFLKKPQVTCLGYWLRNFETFWLLNTNMTKNVLLGRLPYAHQTYQKQKEMFNAKCKHAGEKTNGTIVVHRHLSNKEFDDYMTTTCGFLDLLDTSANNGVTDCISRNIPLLINCHPAIVEYLGEDYPLYFNTIQSANEKINNIELIKETYYYLKKLDKNKFDINTFISDFQATDIYQDL